MPAVTVPRIVIWWLVLLALTFMSFNVVAADWFGADHRVVGAAALILAFVKVRIVGLHFMELHGAPMGLRLPFEIWVVGVCGGTLGFYCL